MGFIDDEQMWKKINIAIKKTFGLWFYNLDRTGDIRCLCPKCLKGYLKRGLKDNTFENYKYMYETFVRNQIGDKRISMLKKSDKSDIKRKDYICVR